MKILLINPPRSNTNGILEFASSEAKKFIHKKLVGPPLGLLTIAAILKDYDVEFLDMKGEYDLNPDAPGTAELVNQYLNDFMPDIVGVTFIASEFNFGIEIFQVVKKFNKNIITVAGGLHVTLCPGDFTDLSIDILCPGESANIFLNIVRAVENKVSPENVNGIIINKNGVLIRTKTPAESWDSSDKNYIMPDRSYLKKWLQTYKVGNNPNPVTYLFTSLGCPYKCSFCSIWPYFNGAYYQRNLESIIHELKLLDDYNVVRFADANTIVNVNFIDKLFDRIIEENIQKEYVMDIRFDTIVKHSGLIEKLAKAGLKVVICGFESYRQEELIKYKKDSSAELIEKAIDILQKNDIMTRGNYVVPNYYDRDDFKALADYAGRHKVVYAGYTVLTPMPGTEFYNEVKDQIIDFDLSKYNFFNSVLKTKLPLEKFYENMSKLWLIKKGKDVI